MLSVRLSKLKMDGYGIFRILKDILYCPRPEEFDVIPVLNQTKHKGDPGNLRRNGNGISNKN